MPLSELRTKSQVGPRGGVSVAFPEKLHQMIGEIEEEGREDIVSWRPHGRAFQILNKKAFLEEVMPR